MRSSTVRLDMITGHQLEQAVTNAVRNGSVPEPPEPTYNFRFDSCARGGLPGLRDGWCCHCAVCSLRLFCPCNKTDCPYETNNTVEEQHTIECSECSLSHSIDKILDRRGGVTRTEYKVSGDLEPLTP